MELILSLLLFSLWQGRNWKIKFVAVFEYVSCNKCSDTKKKKKKKILTTD